MALKRLLNINEPACARSVEKGVCQKASRFCGEIGFLPVDEVFRSVSRRLSDGRRYLLGEKLTFADITFASLAAIFILPSGAILLL